MRIIKAKQSGLDRVVFINAESICSFYSDVYDGKSKTKIYFGNGKCEIEGNDSNEILEFLKNECKESILDLTEGKNEAE